MAGTWSTVTPPQRPGAYFNFVAAAQAAVTPGATGRTAVMGTATWGPENTPYEVSTQAAFDAQQGTDAGTLRDAVLSAFDGFDGSGASTVIAYRLVGSAGAKATLTLTDGSAAAALVLTAKYKGTRGNGFQAVVQANAVVGANKDLILYEDGVEVERWSNVTLGYNQNFVTAINTTSPSKYVTAAVSGASSRTVKNYILGDNALLTAGDDGTTLSTEITAAQTALEPVVFDAIAFPVLSDNNDTKMDTFVAWVKNQNDVAGKRIIGFIGGLAAEDYTTGALARSVEYDSGYIVNLGCTDLKRISDGTVFSTAQVAARLAGCVSGLGLRRAVTNMKLTGWQVNNSLGLTQITSALTDGIVVFSNDSVNRIRVEAGVTSLRTVTTTQPVQYKKIRNVVTAGYIQNVLTNVANDQYVGAIANTATGRRDLVGNFLAFLKTLEDASVLQSGSQASLDDSYVQGGNAVYISFSIGFVDAIERIFTTVKLSA